MNTRPFSKNNRTLIGTSRMITREENSLSSPCFLGKLTIGKNRLNITLEEVIDVDKDLELYCSHQLNLLNPQILYKTNALNFNTQLLRINRERKNLRFGEDSNK